MLTPLEKLKLAIMASHQSLSCGLDKETLLRSHNLSQRCSWKHRNCGCLREAWTGGEALRSFERRALSGKRRLPLPEKFSGS